MTRAAVLAGMSGAAAVGLGAAGTTSAAAQPPVPSVSLSDAATEDARPHDGLIPCGRPERCRGDRDHRHEPGPNYSDALPDPGPALDGGPTEDLTDEPTPPTVPAEGRPWFPAEPADRATLRALYGQDRLRSDADRHPWQNLSGDDTDRAVKEKKAGRHATVDPEPNRDLIVCGTPKCSGRDRPPAQPWQGEEVEDRFGPGERSRPSAGGDDSSGSERRPFRVDRDGPAGSGKESPWPDRGDVPGSGEGSSRLDDGDLSGSGEGSSRLDDGDRSGPEDAVRQQDVVDLPRTAPRTAQWPPDERVACSIHHRPPLPYRTGVYIDLDTSRTLDRLCGPRPRPVTDVADVLSTLRAKAAARSVGSPIHYGRLMGARGASR